MLWRNVLGPKIKLLYNRATLSKWTAAYVLLALANCIVGIALQSMTYADNHAAAQLIDNIIGEAKIATGFTILQNGRLEICTGIPGQRDVRCFALADIVGNFTTLDDLRDIAPALNVNLALSPVSLIVEPTWASAYDQAEISAIFDPAGRLQNVTIADPSGILTTRTLQPKCVASLAWIEDILRDAKREDMVTLFFQVWLFSLSIVAILNESIPHMGAAFIFHVLATAWAGFRVSSTGRLHASYNNHVVQASCDGLDLLGSWWSLRMDHTIPIVIIDAIILFAVGLLSFYLFKVYNHQHMVRVGASSEITRIYKMVLVLSVGLQVAGFITLAATSLWIGKLADCFSKGEGTHIPLYYAAFITTAVLELPWLTLGWISVRREKRIMFAAFMLIGIVLIVIQSLMLSSSLYMFVFQQWSFFGSLTVASYILLVAASAAGITCRLNFGRGLAHYLHVQRALQDVGFTAANFSDDPEQMLHGEIPRFSIMYDEKATITPIGNHSYASASLSHEKKPTQNNQEQPQPISFLKTISPETIDESPLAAVRSREENLSPIAPGPPPGLALPPAAVQSSAPRVKVPYAVGGVARPLTSHGSLGLPSNPRSAGTLPKTSTPSSRI